jgi:hypothetical protein
VTRGIARGIARGVATEAKFEPFSKKRTNSENVLAKRTKQVHVD